MVRGVTAGAQWLGLALSVLCFAGLVRDRDAPATVRVSAPYVSLPVQVALAQGFFK